MQVKYLIIGNSAGGINTTEAIRKIDSDGSITILSDEPYPAYSRPLISKYLSEKRPLEKMLYRQPDFYERNNIEVILGKKAQKLNIAEHEVELADGTKISWEKLLLATGGLAIIPRMEGTEREGVFTFITLDDAKAIDRYLSQLPGGTVRAVVIGGGLIGVSVTEALVKRHVQVTIVEMRDWILNTMLDRDSADVVAETLRGAGVNIITGRSVTSITGNQTGAVGGVILDNGEPLSAEIVIVAVGVRPRVELAVNTAIKVNRGIVVDRSMETSVPGIYACGDAAEAYDFIYDQNRVTPIWPNACIGGRVAGQNMAGVPSECSKCMGMNSLDYFGLSVVSAGMVIPPEDGYEVLAARSNHDIRRIVLKDGRVVGMVFIGNVERSGIIRNLMKAQVDVSHFKKELLAENLNLAVLPREIWEPHFAAPKTGDREGERVTIGK
ncbi:MAG: NAD(P)/FAD-dependent oxidoreductase [Chloroflexi bacterium]|nr:NAD(P)/FAD-dependent oxidoreductase [Chloroflexota bacterium]